MAQYDRWTPASWQLPTEYRGDSLEILARIKAAAEGDTVPLRPQVISRLGAPFGANWSPYPSSDLMLLWVLGRVARVIGVYPAANLALLLGSLTAALSFYGCARWLRARWEWALAGALLFAFTYQSFHRGLNHLFFVYTWMVPLTLLSAGLVATSRRLRLRGATGVFCVGVAAVIGIGNPYALFLYLQLVGWAVVGQLLGVRRRENIVTGVVAIVVAIAAFFVVESHVWLFTADTAAAPPIVRNYGGTERYALKPIELFMPPATHRWEPLAFFGQRYARWSDWRSGESFAPYLGLVGMAAFIWLAVVSFRAVLRRERLPGVALPAAWVLAFASVGGVTNILAFFAGLNVFRATNRFSIFISALVLLFLVTRISTWWHQRSRWWSIGLAGLVAAFGLYDQLPPPAPDAKKVRIAERVASDLEIGQKLERQLPAHAMVFQLPVLGFPEVVPPFQLTDYEFFRPYLGTDTMRFTYGSLKGRSRGRWQRDTAALPTGEMVRELESYGFAALYINRRGFPDRAEHLLAELTAAGRTRRIEGRLGEQVIVFLEPAASPKLPLARAFTFGRGWHESRPGEPRWAYGPATMSFFNPLPRALRCEVRFALRALGDRQVDITLNNRVKIELTLNEKRRELVVPMTLEPGVNHLDVSSRQPPVRMSNERDQLRCFAVYEASVHPTDDAPPGVLAAR
ncbi:hypothetical protein DB354_05470 [Opitutus sp. ER46]|nr:hypothetical protein DB354_05470 [Opitutus sp. ER46]